MELAPQELKVEIKGVVIPTWLAACLLVVAIFSSLSLWLTNETLDQMRREIRLLQLYVQDVESKMIENGQAQRRDFAPWDRKGPDEKQD